MRDKLLSRSKEVSKVSDSRSHNIKEDIPRIQTFSNAFFNKKLYPVSVAFNNRIKYSISCTQLFLCRPPLLSLLFFPSFFRSLLQGHIFSVNPVPSPKIT